MSTYKDAGVDIDAGDRAVELMKASIAKASRPEAMAASAASPDYLMQVHLKI